MKSNVLIVDDNQEILFSIKEALLRHKDEFTVSTAKDGLAALEKLKEECFSLVVTDIKMPRMDGLSLQTYLADEFPHLPVIVMTGYNTEAREKHAKENGCVAYYKKPFEVSILAKKIISEILTQSDSGILQNVTTSMFVQLVQMEQKTCTIRVIDSSTGQNGILFFSNGELLDAITPGMKGVKAAYKVFSWEHVTVAIQNSCVIKENRIKESLQAILLDAMRLKDESLKEKNLPSETDKKQNMKAEKPSALSRFDIFKREISREIGNGFKSEDIVVDNSWQEFISEIAKLGDVFNTGGPKIVYVSKGKSKDYILFPDDDIKVLPVKPNCPRDRIIKIMHDNL